MIQKINVKNSLSTVGHLNVGDDVVTSKACIADVLAVTFAEKSSFSNYSTSSEISKHLKKKINSLSNNDEHYNTDFTIKEFKKVLKTCHNTAVKCRIFNQIWHTGILPDSWKEAIVIPIPRSGKDSANPNYSFDKLYL